MLAGLASFCYRRRRMVLLLWIVALVAINVLSQQAGDAFSQRFRAQRFGLPASHRLVVENPQQPRAS